MRRLNDVELAIQRLATGVTLHYAKQGDQRGGEALYLRALYGGEMSQDIRRGERSWRLVEALFGRRARRFSSGASLPDGPLAFTSRHDLLPLSELEQMLVLTAAGNTGWHYMSH